MPAMPRPKAAKKISEKVMKNSSEEKALEKEKVPIHGENKFDRNIRTMIKR